MAKKRTMNPVEAHVEKISIAIALIVIIVVVMNILKPAGVEIGGRELPPSQAAQQSAEIADGFRQQMEQPRTDIPLPPPYQPRAGLFAQNQPLPPAEVDNIPLTPVYLPNGPQSQDQRTYIIPPMPQLSQPDISLTQAVAVVTASGDAQNDPDQRRNQQSVDVDFVSVEVTFPYDQIRNDFAANFTGARVETPLELAMPLVAGVQLQRSVLMPDGSWSEFQDVAILDRGEPEPLNLPSINEINLLAQSLYDLELENRYYNLSNNPQQQQQIIQPIPYTMDGDDWLPPSQQAELDEQQREERRTAGANQPQQPQPRQPAGLPAGGPGPGAPMIDPMMGPMGPMVGPQQPNQRTSTASSRSRTNRNIPNINWNTVEQLTIWAHDGNVQLGATYRYRIRLGIFNPIAGHNWLTEQQSDLEEERILWTQWAQPEYYVRVPERTAFFPRTANVDTNTLSVDVYRNQNGMWYQQTFVVTPGEAIGTIARVPATGSTRRTTRDRDDREPEELIDVDFRTFATLVDIVPGSSHWVQRGRQYTQRETEDIIYRTPEGNIERLPVDNQCWPADLTSRLTALRREVRGR